MKIIRWFLISSGVILLFTGLAKVLSAMGDSRILALADPVLQISYRHLFILSGSLELALSLYCLLGKNTLLKTQLVASFSTMFAIYRWALSLVHNPPPCHCLGTLTDSIHVAPQMADSIMIVVLVYLVMGSYCALFLTLKTLSDRASYKRQVMT